MSKISRSILNRFAVTAVWFTVGLMLGAIFVPDSRTEKASPDSLSSNQEEEKEVQEPLFEDWTDPVTTLFISGRQNGYLEPCGCTGLENQKGGMMRRHTIYKQLVQKGWNPIGLELGNQVRRYGRQANLQIATTYESLGFEMKYQAIGFGPDDLHLPTLELMAAMTNSGLSTENFVAANVSLFDPVFTSRYRVIGARDRKVCVTMILGDEHLSTLPVSDDVKTMPVDEALTEIGPSMLKEDCKYYVLMAYTSLEKCRALADAYPWFDLIISGGVDGEPTHEPEEIRNSKTGKVTRIVQTGYKGMYVGVVGFFDDPQNPVRYQRVPLDARFEDSEQIKVRFLSYQRQLELLGLEGLEVKPVTHASGREFAGSQSCADCHDVAYDIWENGVDGKGGPHFRATTDLTDPGERTWVKRHFDPECLSCHVTGWNAQKYFPYESGYLKLDQSVLHGNGCENCHGPGSLHVAAENGDIDVDEPTREGYAREMIVTLEQARTQLCFECHDIDNSPDFHKEGAFEKYWERIKHYED